MTDQLQRSRQPYQSPLPPTRDGFGRLVLAEWTKFRSVPRWLLAMAGAIVLTVLMAVFTASGSGFGDDGEPPVLGPDGRPVRDSLQFVHEPLDGDGAITARVLTQRADQETIPPWAKAGVMIKARAQTGAPYAAMAVTPGHGTRMQWNWINDRAGSGDARWVRLTRAGEVVTGYDSVDGRTWRRVGAVTLKGLPTRVEIGLFAATPPVIQTERGLGGSAVGAEGTATTATFGDVSLRPGAWRSSSIGGGSVRFRPSGEPGMATESGGVFTVTSSGDVAPDPVSDERVRLPLSVLVVGMLVVAALGVLSITAEYRRGMIRTTFTASPRRGRVLAAKAVVLAAVTFAAGLVMCVGAVVLSQPMLRDNGFLPPHHQDPSATDPAVLRAVFGSAALVALIAVIGLALGTILRRSAAAIAIVVVLLMVPTIVVSALPIGSGVWLMRLTPIAGSSVQQTSPRYAHSGNPCIPEEGCVFEQPWVGVWVVCAYAAVALLAAFWLLRRRDA